MAVHTLQCDTMHYIAYCANALLNSGNLQEPLRGFLKPVSISAGNILRLQLDYQGLLLSMLAISLKTRKPSDDDGDGHLAHHQYPMIRLQSALLLITGLPSQWLQPA